jgi:hypothetical protein
MRRVAAALLITAVLVTGQGCLVLSLHPAYDDTGIAWDPDLLGSWANPDDKASLDVERGEWKSYRLRYVHPIETGVLTGYLTSVGDERFLDVMPARGQDYGSLLIPVHALVRVRREKDRLELTPLSYDWFSDRIRQGRAIPGLLAALDQKENALIMSPTSRLRSWLRLQPVDGPMFGAPATFVRKPADPDKQTSNDGSRDR